MPDAAAITSGANQTELAVLDLEEKYGLVVKRGGRLKQLIKMRAPGIVVRNEKRMLKAAMDDLFDDAEVEEIISRIGAGAVTSFLSYIIETEIRTPAVAAAGDSLAA